MISPKNKSLQVTIPKKEYDQLETIVEAFNEEGVKCSKSDIVLTALQSYIKMLVMCGQANEQTKQEGETPKEKKDA